MEDCRAISVDGPAKGKKCNRPGKYEGYCGKHLRNKKYDEGIAAGNRWCRNFFAHKKDLVCNNYIEGDVSKACDTCIAKVNVGKVKCIIENCRNYQNIEKYNNEYCGNHQTYYANQLKKNEALERGVVICKSCKIVEIPIENNLKNCTKCLAHTAWIEKGCRDATKINQPEDITKSKCYECNMIFDKFKNMKNEYSTKCGYCYNKFRIIEENRERDRNYNEERYKNPKTAYKLFLRNIKTKNRVNELSIEDYTDISTNYPCTYCRYYKEGEAIGIDRLDNELGYLKSNSLPCCAGCNRSKHTMNPCLFIFQSENITYYQNTKDSSNANDFYNRCSRGFKLKSKIIPYHSYKLTYIKNNPDKTFTLTNEEYINLSTNATCYLCGFQNEILGIDRKDSDIGYTTENCFSCCTLCNMMKNDSILDEFISRTKNVRIPDDSELWEKMLEVPIVVYK